MAQWGKLDQADNSPKFAPAQVNKTANTVNQTAMFGNTTPNAFVSGTTKGVFAVDANEIAVTGNGKKAAHTGWSLRTVGSGGRDGRVQMEVLVAGGITSDAADDTTLPDA